MEILSYQPHSGKYSPFPYGELHPTSKFRTPSSGNAISKHSSILNQNKPADSVSQLRETDDVDGDESSDELPSLRKLLSLTTQPPRNPSRSRSLNPSVQAAGAPAPTLPGVTSAPRKSPFQNVPAWSPFHSSKYASRELNEPVARPPVVPSRCASRGSSEREPVDGSVGGGGYHIIRGSSQENPIVVDDDEDCDPTDRSYHTSHQMTVNGPGVEGENTDGDAGVAAQTDEGDDRLAIATFISPSPQSDSRATLDEERQLHPSPQGDLTASPLGKRSRSPSGSDRADGCGSDWVFDVFAEDDGMTEGDGSPALKRARSSPCPSEAAENKPSRADQEHEVRQIVGESSSEYEVTALTKLWLPKASVDPKLVRKYRAGQREATQIPTRRSSRLQNKN